MKGFSVYPSLSSSAMQESVTRLAKYAMPKGLPVGIDPATDKFVPLIAPNCHPTIIGATNTTIQPARSSYSTRQPGMVKVNTNTFVIVWVNSDVTAIYAKAGTYAPATGVWTWGTTTQLDSAMTDSPEIGLACIGAGKFVVGVSAGTAQGYPVIQVGTVSGTVITLGTASVLKAAVALYGVWIAALDTDKFVAVYDNGATSAYARIGTVSETTVTLGTELDLVAPSSNGRLDVCKTATDTFAVLISNGGVLACTFSGTTITKGDPVLLVNGANSAKGKLCSGGTDNRFVVVVPASATTLCITAGSISTRTVSLGTEVVYNGKGNGDIINPVVVSIVCIAADTYLVQTVFGYFSFVVSTSTITQLYKYVTTFWVTQYSLIQYSGNLCFALSGTYQLNEYGHADLTVHPVALESLRARFSGVLSADSIADATSIAVRRGVVTGVISVGLSPRVGVNIPTSYGVNGADVLLQSEAVMETSANTSKPIELYQYISPTEIRLP